MIGLPKRHIQPEKKGKKTIISFGLFLILIFLLYNFFSTWKKNHEINQEIDSLESQISSMQAENSKLTELIKYFNSNAFIEEKAREDLGFKKQGEKVVMVPESMKNILDTKSDTETKSENLDSLSNPQKWWRYFFE